MAEREQKAVSQWWEEGLFSSIPSQLEQCFFCSRFLGIWIVETAGGKLCSQCAIQFTGPIKIATFLYSQDVMNYIFQ